MVLCCISVRCASFSVALVAYLHFCERLGDEFASQVDIAGTADKERYALVQSAGHDIHDAFYSVGGFAPGLLGDKSEGCRLVEQAGKIPGGLGPTALFFGDKAGERRADFHQVPFSINCGPNSNSSKAP